MLRSNHAAAGTNVQVLPVTKTAAGTFTFHCKVIQTQGMIVASDAVTLTITG